MKFPGGNPLLFCEQVGTVTSFFEQWNDCERTVVLYALLKRVPFANLKFLQLSIDYNLAQNYSSQSKLQLLESHANNANFLNKLVQRYQQTTTTVATNTNNNNNSSSSKPTTGSTPPKPHNTSNNSSCNITNNNNLTISDAGYDSEKTKSTFDLSSTSSLSCSTTSGLGSCSSSSGGSDKPAGKQPSPASPSTEQPEQTVESKKDILNDMLTYLPLLKPGNDDVKSVYMSLIPAAVEDACQQHVPTELVQHILSYLLIHPAVNNDDRRSLSYWLRHLEEHIATSYIPTTLATQSQPLAAAATTANNNNNNNNTSIIPKHANSGSGNYFAHNQHLAANSNTSKPSSQQSLQFLATGPWQHHIQQQQHPQIHNPQHQHHHQQQQQQQHHSSSSGGSRSGSCNQLAQLPPPPPPPAAVGSSSSSSLISISNSSLLSRSQQSLNQTAGGSSSSSSSSSCLDSTSSQLLKTSQNSSAMVMNLDWTTSTEIAGTEEGGGGGGGGGSLAAGIRGSMENLALKEFGSVSFNFPTPPPGTKPIGNGSSVSSGSKHHHHHHHHHQSGASGASNVTSSSSASLSLNGSHHHHPMVLTAATTDLDSSDDNHLSFSKNGTEIFDYDCDYDNEEEFNYLARAAAAVAAAGGGGGGGNAPGGTTAAGSALTPGTATISASKNRVSFDANIHDYLRVPPIGTGDLAELDGASGLLKTRRSNSLTTTMGSGSGSSGGGIERPVGEGGGGLLHQHQKQNNECLSAENLTNLQLLQNKPRSFSLTMESPRSSLTSSGSETRLDDFKQHQHMMKMYGQQPNVGMASIAHWLKSLRLHKYVWLFSNLTYEQMMEMTEEYLASLGVTKGARHKLVLCIQKLRERHGVMQRLEKDLLTGSKATLGPVFEELTNIVLTPMKPVDPDDKHDLGTQFLRLMDLIASLLFTRPSPQDEEYLNVYIWLLERALHNEAFCDNGLQLKELKYKASKLKMTLAPKGHYPKSAGGSMNGGINKPRWSVSNKHNKPEGVPQKTPHRKSSLQYFSSPMQQSASSSGGAPQQPPAAAAAASSSSSHSHLQAIPPHQYYGTGHNNSYNKSSSYPNFASNMSGSSSGGSGTGAVKHQQPHSSQQQQQQQQQPPHHPPGPSHVSHGGGGGGAAAAGNFMYHRHSLNNISAHQHQQQFLQHLQQNQQQQQQQQQLLPSIYLSTSSGGGAGIKSGKAQPVVAAAASSGDGQKGAVAGKEGKQQQQADLLASKSQNNSIGDINSRLEFLCLQMTEQAIN